MNHKHYLDLAASISRLREDDRNYFLGAIGLRKDGAIVTACNGAPKDVTPQHHCEWRLCRKLDRGSIVYVARTGANGKWAMSRPCKTCRIALKSARVAKVYYTISPGEYGRLEP